MLLVWVLLASPSASEAQAHDNDPLVAFSFDEHLPGVVPDASGHDHTGSCTPGATCPAFTATGGHTAGAYDFTGNGNYVEISDESAFDFTTRFTAMVWMKSSNMGNRWAQLVGKGDSAWSIDRHASSGNITFTTFSPSYDNLAGSTDVQDGQWHHIAVTYDGSRKVLYVDGQVDAQRNFTAAIATNNRNVRLGYNEEYPTGQYNGFLDDLRIYDKALTQSEIQDDMATPVGESPPPPPAGTFENEVVLTGLALPTNIEFTPDGRMLIGELAGRIRVVMPGGTAPESTPFLQLTNVGTSLGQQGLMDIQLDPAFTTNGYYYVFYTLGTPNRDRVSRFTASGNTTVAGSEVVLYQDPLNADAEHHGGSLVFDNDGKLYITTGEHFNAPAAQDLSSCRGKILRINLDGTVPTDNPFHDGSGPNCDAAWALGLRNPFRASYDPPTGRMFVGDVGGNVATTAWEEVNLGRRGANYGWAQCEGYCAGYEQPIHAYAHAGRDASVTGGFVYRGSQFPAEYVGSYFYGDYSQNWIRRLTFDANGAVSASLPFMPVDGTADGPWGDIVHLTEGPDGSLYYVDLGYDDTTGTTGVSKIRRIHYTSGDRRPIAQASAAPTSGVAPLAVSFSSAGSNDPDGDPFTYSWDFGDGATSTQPNPTHTYATAGSWSARLTVTAGELDGSSAPITIQVGSLPSVTITSPAADSTFRAGDVISFSGVGSDAEDGPLPPSAFTWQIDFLHDGHVHPSIPLTGVDHGTYTIPVTGHDYEGNTRYRITATVRDSIGLTASTSVTIWPEKVRLTFETEPAGLQLRLDGVSRATPFQSNSLVNFRHTVEAPDQTIGGQQYRFVAWSDGGARSHDVVVPGQDVTLRAQFELDANRPGLVAAYNFDTNGNGMIADRSGNGRNGSCTPGTTCPAFTATGGHSGGGFNFAGNGNYIRLSDEPAFEFSNRLTVMFWMRIPAFANPWEQLVGKGDSTWSIDRYGSTSRISFTTWGPGSDTLVAPTSVAADQWHHIAVTYDGATKRIYVDGLLDAERAYTRSISPNSREVRLGYNEEYPTGQYSGLLDDVRVYDRALSLTEIEEDMAAPVP